MGITLETVLQGEEGRARVYLLLVWHLFFSHARFGVVFFFLQSLGIISVHLKSRLYL